MLCALYAELLVVCIFWEKKGPVLIQNGLYWDSDLVRLLKLEE